MLSQLTTLVLDSTDQLQTAATGIYNRRVFFKDSDGEGVSIQMMHAHNALAAQHKNPDSPDVVYLMYALITCQLWILVSRLVDQNAQLKIGMSVIHTYMCSCQLHARMCAGMFPFLDCKREVVESCGACSSRDVLVLLSVWAVSSRISKCGEST